MARRKGHGVLLPGIVFTLLACAGVVTLLVTGAPVIDQLSGHRVSSGGHQPRGVPVAPSPTPSARPTTPPPPPPPPTVRPSVATTVGPRPATSAPATRRPQPAPTKTAAPVRPPATAAPSCKAGSAVVTPTADTYVDQGMPRQSFGGADNLLVASRDKQRNRRTLVRFALPSVPSGCTLRSATLTLNAGEPSGRRLLVSRASRGWNESSTTWANAPGAAGAASSATASATAVRFAVTGQVAAMRASGNYGFLVRDAAEGAKNVPQTNFAARQSRRAPTLTLRWS